LGKKGPTEEEQQAALLYEMKGEDEGRMAH
jgi:hypothetical protein